MDKIKKAFREIKYNFNHLNRNLNYIHNRSGKMRIVLFFDIYYSMIRYGSTINEYRIFEFEKTSCDKRKTFMTIFKHELMLPYLNDKDKISIITDKDIFYNKFKDYIKRDIYDVDKMSFKEYEDLVLKSKKVICKRKNGNYATTYKVYDLKDFRSPAFLIDQVKNDKRLIVEKCFNQKKELNELNKDLVVINIVSCYSGKVDIITGSIKFKEGNETITGNIDIKNKCIKGHLKDMDGLNYSDSFEGFEIPKFDNIISLTEKLHHEIRDIKEIEWSFAISSRGTIYLLDANPWDDYVFSQTPEFLNNRVGLYPYYKRNKRKLKYY